MVGHLEAAHRMPSTLEQPYPHEAYDAAYYERLAEEAERGVASHRWRMCWLDRVLNVQPGDRVVDLGSGAGLVSHHLAERGATVDAVDLSEEAVAFARNRWGHLSIDFDVADAAHCNHLASNRYDKAACCDLIEHVHDGTMLGVFREALRLLKPGGLLYVYSPNRDHWIERMKHRNFILRNPVGHICVRRTEEVTAALRECGFEIARVARPTSILPFVRYLEWLWVRLPVYPPLAIYRVCLLARKPAL